MMKERLVTKVDFSGKTNPSALVTEVVLCKRETGATREILCTSAIVAFGRYRLEAKGK